MLPDTDGKGYWLVTSVGAVYAFGDAPFKGAPGATPSPITSAVHTLDGDGYWILTADGSLYAYAAAPKNFSLPVSGAGLLHITSSAVVTSAKSAPNKYHRGMRAGRFCVEEVG